MKKVKKLMLVLLLTVGAYLLVGISSVKATGKIICNPDTLASSTSTTQSECFVVNEDTNSTYHGVILEVYTTENLEIVSAKTVEQIKLNTSDNTAVEPIAVGSKGSVHSTYVCGNTTDSNSANLSKIGSTTTSQCFILYTLDKSSYATSGYFTPTNRTITASDSTLSSGDAEKYRVLGSVTVKLNRTDLNSNECGNICVLATSVASSSGYVSRESYTSNDSSTHSTIVGDTSQTYGYYCSEIHYTTEATVEPTTPTTPNEETGSFISYAILAAGAFIAISAVAIAKKNKKVYKV